MNACEIVKNKYVTLVCTIFLSAFPPTFLCPQTEINLTLSARQRCCTIYLCIYCMYVCMRLLGGNNCYSLKTIQRSFECFSLLLFDFLRLLIVSLFARFVIVFCYLFSFLSALPQLFRFVLPTYIDDDLCRSRISGLLPNALSPRLAVNCESCSKNNCNMQIISTIYRFSCGLCVQLK